MLSALERNLCCMCLCWTVPSCSPETTAGLGSTCVGKGPRTTATALLNQDQCSALPSPTLPPYQACNGEGNWVFQPLPTPH